MMLVAILLPLFSSLFNGNYLNTTSEGEYRSFCKALLLMPIISSCIFTINKKNILANIFLISIFCLSLIFIFRYLVLGEVRDYDLRPLLNIKNGDPNILSTYFTAAIPFTVYFYRTNVNRSRKLGYLLMCLMFVACTFLNQSRMGLITLAISMLLILLLLPWKINKSALLVFFFITSVAVLYLFGAKILIRFSHMTDTSNQDRMKTLLAGLYTFMKAPLFGVGWNNSSAYFYKFAGYPAFQSEISPYEVHDTALKILSELGIFGLTYYVGVISIIARKLVLYARFDKELSRLMLIALSSLTLNSLTISIGYKDIYILFLIVIFTLANTNNGNVLKLVEN